MTRFQRNRLLLRLRPVALMVPIAAPGGIALVWDRYLQAWLAALSPFSTMLVVGAAVGWVCLTAYAATRLTTRLLPFRRNAHPLRFVATLLLGLVIFALYGLYAGLFSVFIHSCAHDLFSALP